MNENSFSWINIQMCLHIANYTLFYKSSNIFTFGKVSGVEIYTGFLGIDFHVDIDMKTLYFFSLPFSHRSLVKHLSWLRLSGHILSVRSF